MKSLSDIRGAVVARSESKRLDTAKVITVSINKEDKKVSISNKKYLKTITKLIEDKKKELEAILLSTRIVKDQTAKTSAFLIEKAEKSAKQLINQAEKDKAKAKELVIQAEQTKKTSDSIFEKLKVKESEFNLEKELLDEQKTLLEEEKLQYIRKTSQIEADRQMIHTVLETVMSLLFVTIDSVTPLLRLQDSEVSTIDKILTNYKRTTDILIAWENRLTGKEETLKNKDVQLTQKWDTIKEQRLQLNMAEKEINNKK